MTYLWGRLCPVAQATLWSSLCAVSAYAAEPQLPLTTVSEQAVEDGLKPEQASYATEVVNRAQLERQQVLDIRDATHDMINVEVPRTARRGAGIGGTAGREANTGFEIRGLGGNRVLTLIDGIAQPEADSFMNSHSFGRDYVDPLTLAAIEVHKGASGVEMPAGGIAGAVNLRTLSPADLLVDGKTLAGRALLGWRSESQGKTVGLALAGKVAQQWQWLLSLNGDWSDEVKTMGHVGGTGLRRTRANPEDNRRHSALAKLVFKPDAQQTHVLTVEHRRQSTDVNNLHDFDNGSTRSHTEDNSNRRSRISLRSDFVVGSALADALRSYLAWQDSSNEQMLALDTTTVNGWRLRDHSYDERLWQAGVQARKQLGLHHLLYGADVTRTESETSSLSTDRGITTPVPKGPDSRTTRWGVYVQDSMEVGAWTILPGLRYESVKIRPDTGSIDMGASGASPVRKSFDAWLPQLGAQWQLQPQLQVFAHYQRGFRAPTSGELNNFFGNITPYYGYYILPNPDLKAETSHNFELGLRNTHGATQWEVTAFHARYRNFIERYATAGSMGTRPVVSLQQSRNQAKAKIHGIELRGKTELGQSWGGTWQVRGGYGYTKGTGENGEGLESISPHQFKLGLGQCAARWNWELAATYSAAKQRGDLPKDSSSVFVSPSHTVLDLSAQLQLRKGMRLNVGLFNLTDKKYWNWSDVRGVTAASELAAIDAYSQPGRNLRISLVADF